MRSKGGSRVTMSQPFLNTYRSFTVCHFTPALIKTHDGVFQRPPNCDPFIQMPIVIDSPDKPMPL